MEILTVALGPGGAGTAMAATVVAWLRSRHSKVEIEVKSADGTTVRLKAANLRGMSSADVTDQIGQLSALLAGEPADTPPEQ